jgi:hypothetical protein
MYEIYEQTLMEQIQNTNFSSIEADKITDIVVLLQYVKYDGPVERFSSFLQVQNYMVGGLPSFLKQ